jgi:trehalose synthase
MGKKARETVIKRFLMTRYLEQYLDLFNSFETLYRLTGLPKNYQSTL